MEDYENSTKLSISVCFLSRNLRKRGLCCRPVSVRLSVRRLVDCIHTAEDIVKLISHMRSIKWRHIQWPWWTPNPVFKVTAYLKSNM